MSKWTRRASGGPPSCVLTIFKAADEVTESLDPRKPNVNQL